MKKNKSLCTLYNDHIDSVVIEQELSREIYKNTYKKTLYVTLLSLIIVAAVAVIISNYFISVFRLYGNSMIPTLKENCVLLSINKSEPEHKDVIAFYVGNKLLIKRVVACPGDIIDINETGEVYVNGNRVDESYVSNLCLGESDIEYPYKVPDNRWFVLSDNREIYLDSRNSAVGCISQEQIVGKVVFCIWPLSCFSKI